MFQMLCEAALYDKFEHCHVGECCRCQFRHAYMSAFGAQSVLERPHEAFSVLLPPICRCIRYSTLVSRQGCDVKHKSTLFRSAQDQIGWIPSSGPGHT